MSGPEPAIAVGLEGAWVEDERGTLQGLLVVALETLSAAHSALGDHRLAVAAATEAVAAELSARRRIAGSCPPTTFRATGRRR